jgi:hypothetical protein
MPHVLMPREVSEGGRVLLGTGCNWIAAYETLTAAFTFYCDCIAIRLRHSMLRFESRKHLKSDQVRTSAGDSIALTGPLFASGG